ncbi:hypothetical protein FPCIR_5936 [Fusarium pseudocircinatum]|uniref:Uncharacterized protein n=1 Tax=Fusarium pseudocircinatum TaxID=56676 RepID=A0A8H5P897_9HYPO|nr:hypothetical protein FPCIR_5936 [Fusarium pseudocircinatum]
MADLNRRDSRKNSELIRQGIVQCLALEAECRTLRASLEDTKNNMQKLKAQMTEMVVEHEGLMKILEEKDALIEKYSALMSVTLDKSVRRERQDLRAVEDKVFWALDLLDDEMSRLGLEQQGPSGPSELRAKRPGLIRQGAIVPGTSTSDRSRPRNSRETTPKLLRQDAQMYKREEGKESPEVDSLLQMACEAIIQKPK